MVMASHRSLFYDIGSRREKAAGEVKIRYTVITGINPNKQCGVMSQPVGSLQEDSGTKHNESRFGGWQFLFTKI